MKLLSPKKKSEWVWVVEAHLCHAERGSLPGMDPGPRLVYISGPPCSSEHSLRRRNQCGSMLNWRPGSLCGAVAQWISKGRESRSGCFGFPPVELLHSERLFTETCVWLTLFMSVEPTSSHSAVKEGVLSSLPPGLAPSPGPGLPGPWPRDPDPQLCSSCGQKHRKGFQTF